MTAWKTVATGEVPQTRVSVTKREQVSTLISPTDFPALGQATELLPKKRRPQLSSDASQPMQRDRDIDLERDRSEDWDRGKSLS